ncbi:MAG TPA: glycosyltransferase [Candidatus Gastranaerophilales bacterium]|nr:glycosyltransferase [Candidatus Gastranaerophilales bacterium]
MDNFKIGIIADESGKGGMNNILGGFGVGLKNGFCQINIDADYINNILKNTTELPPVFIAFNVSGSNMYDSILNAGSNLIVWSVDSIFFKNFNLFKKYAAKPNFYGMSVTPTDVDPVKLFLPKLKYFTMYVGTDPKVWKYDENAIKEHDIVFMSYLTNYKADIENLKETLPPSSYKLFLEVYNYIMENPDKNMWESFSLILKNYNIDVMPQDANFYSDFFIKVSYIITHTRRVELVKSLEDVGVKVWGAPEWEKHISGRNKYMGLAEMNEAAEIFGKSKIVLHQHPVQVANCAHERIINACATGAFVVSDNIPVINEQFKDNILYFNPLNAEELCDNVNFYLKNDDLRQEKALAAREITINNHTWSHRAKEIMSLFTIC